MFENSSQQTPRAIAFNFYLSLDKPEDQLTEAEKDQLKTDEEVIQHLSQCLNNHFFYEKYKEPLGHKWINEYTIDYLYVLF